MVSLLVVVESETFQPSAVVRAGQYRAHFAASTRLRAEIFPRRVREDLVPAGWFRVPVLGWLLGHAEHRLRLRLQRRRDRELLRRAAAADAVYLVKVPHADLHLALWALDGPRVILDVNDAIWHRGHREGGYARFAEMMRCSDLLLCENEELRARVAEWSDRLDLVPDCPQAEDFPPDPGVRGAPDRPVRLGWVGSRGTAGALHRLLEPLEDLAAEGLNFELRVVGAARGDIPAFERTPVTCLPAYGRDDMMREIQLMDVGVFPLFQVEDARMRGNLKAKVYMAGGAVAACQDLGECRRLIRHGETGVLCGDSDSWRTELRRLITRPDERRAIAAAGQRLVRAEFSRDACYARLESALVAAAARPRAPRSTPAPASRTTP
jgi:glycosyltransferase involved in cell wall biosynthesis